ncbi:MAG: hypothetical protein ACLSVD_17540 [Eggerthellaceae bacterium]
MTTSVMPASSSAFTWAMDVTYSPPATTTVPSAATASSSRQRPIRFSSRSPFSL